MRKYKITFKPKCVTDCVHHVQADVMSASTLALVSLVPKNQPNNQASLCWWTLIARFTYLVFILHPRPSKNNCTSLAVQLYTEWTYVTTTRRRRVITTHRSS